MSVEAPKIVEESAPVETKPVEQSTTETPSAAAVTTDSSAVVDAPKTETTETPAAAGAVTTSEETKPVEETKKEEPVAAAETVSASEGVLGYKAPGFLKQFHFSKHFFWFSDEALSSDALNTYSRSDKTSVAQNAAWARETGKGVLFHTKRSEDKAHPAGLIPLYEAVGITKDGVNGFSFDVQGKTHKFEATTAAERDSWVMAIENQHKESKSLKDEITAKDSYKKNLEEYSKPATAAPAVAAASRSKSKDPKKSLDANTATAATTATPATTEAKPEETAAPAPVVPEKKVEGTKERSQSRKRASIFGSFMGKKDETKKAEEKIEKQEKQDDKKVEAELKKEEAKEEHSATKATEAAAAAAVAAAPAAVISTDKKEEKVEPTTETPTTGATATAPTTETTTTTPATEKTKKRGSVFGTLFNKVTSPTTEKSEKDVGPTPPAKDDVPPVSDTAPKLDEPIDTKPIDTAAVTAPANTDGAADTPKETTATRPEVKSEKKSFLGFMKKPETKKEESAQVEKPAEAKPVEPPVDATPTALPVATTDATETAAKSDSETPIDDKKIPTEKEKRRTSLFGGLGTIKKRDEAKTTENGSERKREKSPMPSKIGGLFRKPSKAVKSEESKPVTETKTETPAATKAVTEPAATTDNVADAPKVDAPATNGTDSQIVGDVVPEALTTQDKVATAPEVKASA